MWCLGTWFSSELGSVWLMVVLNDLNILFQLERFYKSMKVKWFNCNMTYKDVKSQGPYPGFSRNSFLLSSCTLL